ncbi:glycosyltransferase [Isobaculum melis]|uniref:Glycosyltransferase, GT2 family n=1 Tax=Isobaculum melis TaxID=142588 RepID=A0A1H9QQ62_9LACT|nr:glycosyltransferase [Isobaculum melis]SER62584.1 Glycosyltransferase, GT2 family [Isobaculum melis]
MKLTIVLVLYQRLLEESETYQSLLSYEYLFESLQIDYELLVYDNSLEKINKANEKITYFHNPKNPGIAVAYNEAFSIGKKNQSSWLLLLDQDTQLTEAYLQELLLLSKTEKKASAIVPKVFFGEQQISPVFAKNLRHLEEDVTITGLTNQKIMSINSGTLLSMAFMEKIGGFNPNFKLDYLDHWLFHQLAELNESIYVMNAHLQHDLSVMNYKNVSLSRYQSILDAEVYFYQHFQKDLYPQYKKHLFLRACKQLLLVGNKKIALYSYKKFFRLRGNNV